MILTILQDYIKQNMSLETLYGSNKEGNILMQRYEYYKKSWELYVY